MPGRLFGFSARIAFAALTLNWLALACACNRTEEPATPLVSEPTSGVGGSSANNGGGPSSAPTTPARSPSPGPTPNPSSSGMCTVPFAAAPVASAAAQCPKDPTGNLTLPMGRVTFSEAPGAPAVAVELARNEASRERGLMYRTSMPENAGMLFSWQDERVRSFWMHNTCIPLDLLYITKDGTISGILEQVPTLNDAPRRIACPVAHVLELNAGWARAHGVAPGMKVKIEG
ncbi:MAG TPA: DUF192 domain-containing protein [Polyangiaceae bacterium]|nr:DUF192 domain-containing protein [Polyangiaceae bacterium]